MRYSFWVESTDEGRTWHRRGQKQASQAGLLAFCARLCSTEAGHELCSTVVTPRPHQLWQFADLVERARLTWKRHGLCSSVSGLLEVDIACVVIDVLADVSSNKVWQETVCPCCLTCQLPRFPDLVVEELVEVGDVVVGRTPLNDVAVLRPQFHRLETGK